MNTHSLNYFWTVLGKKYTQMLAQTYKAKQTESTPQIIYLAEIDSTNSEGKRRIDFHLQNKPQNESSLFSPLVLLAGHQTSGKGQAGRRWLNSSSQSALLQTVVVKTTAPAQPTLTLKLGLAVYREILKEFPDLALSLKAPNDLYLDDKKLAGLLVEGVSQGDEHFLIAGLGLNIFESPEIEIATNLPESIQQQPEKLASVFTQILNEWIKIFETAASPLTPIETKELLLALNRWPHLQNAYTQIAPDGTLWDTKAN